MYLGQTPAAKPMPVLRGTAMGASIGTSILPGIGTAVGAAIGAVGGLLVGKKHYSPWGFLYDDYPQRIYNNEIQIVNAKNAVNQLQGQPMLPKPPGPPPSKGGAEWQASMQAIVPQYVPGSEQQIAAYDRRLNESGGAFERTYGMQLQLLPQIQSTLSSLQTAAAIRGNVPASASATLPPMLVTQGPSPMSPATVQVPSSSGSLYTPPTPSVYAPSPSSDMTPGQPVQAGMLSLPGMDTNSAMPWVLGGLGLLFVIASAFDKKGR